MKNIIYTRTDGGLSVVHPAEGARLAFWITFADGTVIPKDANLPGLKNVPSLPVDNFLRLWPVSGVVANWAETEDEFAARIAHKDVPVSLINPPNGIPEMMARLDAEKQGFEFSETPFAIVDNSVIPQDRTFRNAWRQSGSAIVHDMPACRELWRVKFRQLRTPKLAVLDMAYLRADEVGDTAEKQRIAAEKQLLRDVTADPRIDAATTPEELKTIIPDILK